MTSSRVALLLLSASLVSCSMHGQRGTLADLRKVDVELTEEKIDGGLEKAMESYQRFLEETPESARTPEAIRRLADLKIEKEYGAVASINGELAEPKRETTTPAEPDSPATLEPPTALEMPGKDKQEPPAQTTDAARTASNSASQVIADVRGESDRDFEKRATDTPSIESTPDLDAPLPDTSDDLMRAGAVEAIALYKDLLAKYPLYERNDQVFYQMSRAYEELGQVEEAMDVMNGMVRDYPNSTYMDEVQFRRGEFFFTRKQFLDAEDAYRAIVDLGETSRYYELALYKLGWTFYKQELYDEALHKFIAALDYKVSIGYDFEKTEGKNSDKRLEDTFRVISLSFSSLGGAEAVTGYFSQYGSRQYETDIYSHLGEFYLQKRRYSDAAESYRAFLELHPFHKVAPHFGMRVVEIFKEGGFPKLVVEAKKEFAGNYGVNAAFWHQFDISEHPEVVGYLKTNIMDLAGHYHALYQDERFAENKTDNYHEALQWYREFLESFPKDEDSPPINYQLADLLLENKSYGDAALEYERTAYDYASHEKAAAAGYAAVFSHREHLKSVAQAERGQVKQEAVRSSLKFSDTFPDHDKADLVLGAAADDLYEMQNFELAKTTGRKLIEHYPTADESLRRSAWIVVAHASFELTDYEDAEHAYLSILELTGSDHDSRAGFVDNLAASVYKQGERANTLQEHRIAADHFLRIASLAPTSTIRPTAEYDAVAALMQLEEWEEAASVLAGFRQSYPGHALQPEVTKKMAFVYKEAGNLDLAAAEFERIEEESDNPDVRRDALLTAAELYEQTTDTERALDVYLRYLGYFPAPIDMALETRFKVAGFYDERDDEDNYRLQLRKIVDIHAQAGAEGTDRSNYLAARSALVLTEPLYDDFLAVKLVEPIQQSLERKQARMKAAINAFSELVDYEVGDVTAAATFHMAEMYYEFSRSLMDSERPSELSPLELEQYELALEDQSFPFEEKALDVHEKNVELITIGIYNEWVEKSLSRLATLIPARYAKPEADTGYIATLGSFTYFPHSDSHEPEDQKAKDPKARDPKAEEQTLSAAEPDTAEPMTVAVLGLPSVGTAKCFAVELFNRRRRMFLYEQSE